MQKAKWIDISVSIKSGMVHWPGDPDVRIRMTKDMEKGDPNNLSSMTMGSHTGTHMDGPFHFIAKGKGLDKMPFDATIGPARVLAIKDKQCIGVEELKPYKIKPDERLIFKTRNSSYWATDLFHKDFVYIPSETAKYLIDLGVKTVGIDYLSVGGWRKDGAKTHKLLLGGDVWIIEGLNLSGVKPGNYDLICLPIKILNSDGAPCRAIIRPRARN
jgi:arylformamidase